MVISQCNMDTRRLLQRFPEFAKPSYETVVHKKVSEDYDIEVAVPFGKRAFIWFTFMGKDNICCIITVGKNNQLQDNIHFVPWNFSQEFAYGTLLSGYVTDIEETDDCDATKKIFIVDDLFCYKGYEFGNPFPCVFQKKITTWQNMDMEKSIVAQLNIENRLIKKLKEDPQQVYNRYIC